MGYTNGKDQQAAAYPAPAPPPPPPLEPAPIAAPAETAPTELGQVLSPSQTNTFIECPAQWYFKYLVGLPEPATGSLGRCPLIRRK